MTLPVITISGPVASGKLSIAREFAEFLKVRGWSRAEIFEIDEAAEIKPSSDSVISINVITTHCVSAETVGLVP